MYVLKPRPGALAALALAGCALASPSPAGAVPGSPSSAPSPEVAWLDRMEAFYDAHPQLKDQRGSGWKPYNRIRWNMERQLTDGSLPTSDEVLAVWSARRDRSAAGLPRSAWFQVGPANLSGRITTIEFHPTDPNTVYIGSASGGVYKSTDGGDTYASVGDQLPSLLVGAIAVHDFDPNVVLIGTGEGAGGASGVGILKSTDGGATWNTTSVSFGLPSGHGFHVMEVNPLTGTVIAGATNGLYRSTDMGDTWTLVRNDGDYYDVKIRPGDGTRMYTCKGFAANGNQVKASDDDGVTWANVGTGQPAQNLVGKTKLAVTAADPNVIYANYTRSDNYQTLGVYRSTDNGATWTPQNTSLNMTNSQGWYNLTLTVDPDDPAHLLAGGVELWESTNSGVNWTSIHSFSVMGTDTDIHWDHHAIAYEPGSTDNVWVGTDGGVWRSTDDGGSWLSRREGLPTYQFYDICVAQSDPVFLLGGSQDNGLTPRDSADTWVTSTLTADGMVCNINPTNANAVYGEWQFGNHVKSFNGGTTWSDIMNGITGSGSWVTPVDEDQNVPNHLYTSTSSGIFRTTQGGNLWVNVAPHTAIWISMNPMDGNTVWTVNSTQVWVTADDGGSWTLAAPYGFSVGNETKIQAHPTDVGTAFVTFGGFSSSAHVAMTTDYGSTWSDVTGDLPAQPVNTMIADPAEPSHWYIGTDFGVWTSTNGGVNWTPFGAGFPNVVVTDLEIHRTNRKLVAGTYGRGAWEIALPGGVTDAEVAVAAGPLNLMLDAPSPNPVRDRTWLRFAAKHSGPVTLDVFDVSGRRVSRIAELSSGDGIIRTAPWIAADAPSGVYFAVLSAGSDRRSVKVVVAR